MAGAPLVLGFGAIAIDDIVYVDRPLSAGKGRVLRRAQAHGGNVATALAAVARLGGSAGFIGWLSDDEGDASVCDLRALGVDIGAAPRHPQARAIRSIVTVGPDGDRFIAYDDAVLHGTSDQMADAVLAPARVLVVDSYAAPSLEVVARARRLGLALVADIEWTDGAGTDALVALCDHLVVPMGHACAMAGCDDPARILDLLWSDARRAVVVTDGEKGVFFRHLDERWHLPAHAVTAVDTTGAGDCFHGAYAHALSLGHDTAECVRIASAAAALSVTGRGGREALPDMAQVEALLAAEGAPSAVAMRTTGLHPEGKSARPHPKKLQKEK